MVRPQYPIQTPSTFTPSSEGSIPVSEGDASDAFSTSWLAKFDADFQAMLRGSTPSSANNRTVSGGATPATPTSSFTKNFKNYSDSLSDHLKNGGSGTVFHNPVMHYDLNSMKDRFKAVNEAAGIYERDGVFYATRDVNGQTLLQPVGIHAGRANGLSDDLSDEQKAYFDQLWEAMKKMQDVEGLQPEVAKAKLMETVREPDKLQQFMDKYGPKETPSESSTNERSAEGKTHDSDQKPASK